ncbi:hypothetical protein H6S82_09085 [Planktothrix sp. FACHB-1355]|uniref:Uncharacterized protein n=1 Tax=Aerosakkonema funiforme FACHB-1375 TaxID=2949571 RepID=A0A926ZJF8_9CYAN|nr:MULTISPECIES: hypothetical protein [Oscillatoriales]MBD2184629.1 hypothetical protein [Aerosakkonema funiforme FACHB-1375]MBD3559010.1 hypothetical protein [Planktothrix sp. FACHB-1355]
MLELKYSKPSQPATQTTLNSPGADVEERLEDLERADRSLYKMIGMEVWSIAKTMDDIYPGFWNQFMANRRIAMKNFIDQKQNHRANEEHPFL